MQNLFRYAARGAAYAAFGLLVPITSHAFLIDSTTALNSQFTVNYLLAVGASDGNGNINKTQTQGNDTYTAQDISATVIYTLTGFNTSADTISFRLDVTNTSENLANEVGLQAIAFGTDPMATNVTFNQITVTGDINKFLSATLTIDPNLGNAVANLDVQSSTGVGYGSTLQEGQLDAFLLTVSFADLTNAGVNFKPFGSKWQANPPSFQFGGSESNGGGPPTGETPEPGVLFLMGAGLLGLGMARRRKSA